MWVVDASVAVRWFIHEETHPHAEKVLEKIIETPENFAVPELFPFEVFSVLQRLHPEAMNVFRKGVIPLLQGGILRHPMTEDLAVKADRYVRLGLTGYDACYAAMAEDLKGLWITFDKKAHRLLEKENVSFSLHEKLPDELHASG